MKISVVTLFPEMFESFVSTSIIARSIQKGVVQFQFHNFRDYSFDKHHHVDDTPYGGGAGMVLSCQPLLDCLKAIREEDSHVIMLSPQGKTFDQAHATYLANTYDNIVFVCGHYEGFDERVREAVDEELSIGDYVLTGGELGAMVVSDAIIRLKEGAITKESHEDDSFSNGLLEYPQYTKPLVYDGKTVPEVLTSGHHENIRKWRLYQSLLRTYQKRPDLLVNRTFTKEELKMLEEIKASKKD